MPIVVLVLIAVAWLMSITIVVGLCRMAAEADRVLRRQVAESRRAGATHRPLRSPARFARAS